MKLLTRLIVQMVWWNTMVNFLAILLLLFSFGLYCLTIEKLD